MSESSESSTKTATAAPADPLAEKLMSESSESPTKTATAAPPEPLTLWQKPWQHTVYMVVIIIGALATIGAAGAMVAELWGAPHISTFVFWAFCLGITSWVCFFVAALWFAYVVQWAVPTEVGKRYRRSAWRHVGYQIGVFMILALSLRAFGLHDAEPPMASPEQETTATGSSTAGLAKKPHVNTKHVMLTASELAAIMILFVLAELAALLGKDVAQATDEIESVRDEAHEARVSMREARVSLDASRIAVSESAAAIKGSIENLRRMEVPLEVEKMHTEVKSNVVELLRAWSSRATHQHDKGDPLVSVAWKVFLQEYTKKELQDFQPDALQTEGVPISAQPYPSGGKPGGDGLFSVTEKSVAYVATNIGFYATFLSELVKEMVSKAGTKRVSVAVLTTVLPAYWWNWPRSTGRMLAYSPIEALRTTMAGLSDQVRSDRLILVRNGGTPPADPTSRTSSARESALENEELLNEMESWFVARAASDPDLLLCSDEPEEAVAKLMAKMPEDLQYSLKKEGGSIHPLFKEWPGDPLIMEDRSWEVRPLVDEFSKLHKGGGACWVLAVDDDFIVDKMEGRYDFTFIGVSNNEVKGKLGAWSGNSVEWKFCIMTSISDTNETMFMTLIEGEAARMQMVKCQNHLRQHIAKARPLTNRSSLPAQVAASGV